MSAPKISAAGAGAAPRWVDNQSTESSFHSHQFKADGVLRLVEVGGEGKGRTLISFGSSRLHLTPFRHKKKKKIANQTCAATKINTGTKSEETEIEGCGGVKNRWGCGAGGSEETDGMNVDVLLVGLRCLEAAAS